MESVTSTAIPRLLFSASSNKPMISSLSSFVSLPPKLSHLPHRPISLRTRNLTTAVRSLVIPISNPPNMGSQSFFRSTLSNMEKVYLNRNPTASSILDLVTNSDGNPVSYDHLAFRTFGVDGHGIDSMAKFFLDFGYSQREELKFPAKKLRALWFAPPVVEGNGSCDGLTGPLPRIFISELLVGEMSSQTQEIIRKYVKMSGHGNQYAALASTLGCLTWEKPIYSDYLQLSRESEYAAWTLVNGYAVNHVTISVHRLKSHIRKIKSLNKFIEDQGYKLNSEGGTLKVSPDGLLLQSSTVADSTMFNFADGISEPVPCSYIEFAERLVLPQYEKLADEELLYMHTSRLVHEPLPIFTAPGRRAPVRCPLHIFRSTRRQVQRIAYRSRNFTGETDLRWVMLIRYLRAPRKINSRGKLDKGLCFCDV